MIHGANLPVATRRHLSEILFLQLKILRWATGEREITKEKCEAWLSGKPRFSGRASHIADWLWRSAKRHKTLENFAEGPGSQKDVWTRQLVEEACRFLRKKSPKGGFQPFHKTGAPPWKKAGAEFLIQFYNEFRYSENGLPAILFEDSASNGFTAQDFLDAFLLENKRLCVCPACDETGFYTVARGGVRCEIDHYLPKDFYPHLAIHPFNLILLCHACNSWTKGNRDPLAKPNGERRELDEIWLPYRESGLSSRTFIDVHFIGGHGSVEFREIKARHGHILRERIETLREIYDLPQRWSERQDEIGEHLFRRMRDFFRFFPDTETGNFLAGVSNCLDELLCIFHGDDLAREPFVFPMTWWLSKLINEGLDSEDAPLAREIHDWIHPSSGSAERMQACGRDIRQLMR